MFIYMMQLRKNMPSWLDLRDWLEALESKDMLVKVDRPINVATELTPLVRLQFRGLPEEMRKGFLFNNVISPKGEKMKMRVATAIYAASMKMYALALNCEPNNESIRKKWTEALLNPIKPRLVSSGKVQEVVITRKQIDEGAPGLEALPVPVEVPGFSGQIRTTTQIMTKDPKTGWINLGNYSAHIFGRAKALWEINRGNHGWIHWLNAKELGKDLECAIIIGGPPVLFYVGAAKIPAMVDELDIAGGLTGEPIEVVKCKTVDLEVPANAEIVIEGRISTKKMEPGNAFGEYTGYMATEVFLRPVIDVTCITHRRDPIFVHIMSQMPPSESSKVRQISSENLYYKFLKYDCKIPGIIDVAWHEISQAQWCVIQMKKTNNTDPWRVLHLAAGYDARWGKFFITVDEDIDPRDIDSVIWALSWRVQPKRDVEIIGGRFAGLDISAYRPDAPYTEKEMPNITGSSAILIDATMKWPYPPVSLPKREFMENALKIWKEIGLPELKLKQPWFGYNLGHWTKENEEDAEDILRGDFESVGKRLEEKAGRLSSSNSTSTF
jgi:4-hydroxy-3-polyprenylbenzoate decarboxylase